MSWHCTLYAIYFYRVTQMHRAINENEKRTITHTSQIISLFYYAWNLRGANSTARGNFFSESLLLNKKNSETSKVDTSFLCIELYFFIFVLNDIGELRLEKTLRYLEKNSRKFRYKKQMINGKSEMLYLQRQRTVHLRLATLHITYLANM